MKFFKPIYTEDYKAVIPYLGDKYSVEIELIYNDYGMPTDCKILEFKRVSEDTPLTKSNFERNSWSLVKWGGSPRFIQDEYYPMTDYDVPYDFLCTVEDGWGDSGNCNVFILTEPYEDGMMVVDVFVEASCC